MFSPSNKLKKQQAERAEHVKIWDEWKAEPYKGVCSFIQSYEHGERWSKTFHGPCHAALNYGTVNMTSFSTGLRKSPNMEEAHQWWDFILDPKESPWREALKQGLEYLDDEKTVVFFPHTIGLDNKMLAALCVATRTPWEHPDSVSTWVEVQKPEYGLDKYQALVAMVSIKTRRGAGQYAETRYAGGHFPFNKQAPLSVKAMREGRSLRKKAIIKEDKRALYDGFGSIFELEPTDPKLANVLVHKSLCVERDVEININKDVYQGPFASIYAEDAAEHNDLRSYPMSTHRIATEKLELDF